MHGMHGPSAYGHALMPENLDPSQGLNSSTALWMTWEIYLIALFFIN
jgi:hypothetical protein